MAQCNNYNDSTQQLKLIFNVKKDKKLAVNLN